VGVFVSICVCVVILIMFMNAVSLFLPCCIYSPMLFVPLPLPPHSKFGPGDGPAAAVVVAAIVMMMMIPVAFPLLFS